MPRAAYTSVAAARTRTAMQILDTESYLTDYIALHGLREDLEKVRDLGLRAEALNTAQGQVQADGKSATIEALMAYVDLCKRYSLLMSALRTELGDLKLEKASDVLIKKVEAILVNEAETAVRIAEGEDGTKTRTVRRKVAQEAVRAEMKRDAEGLIALEGLHERMARRKIDRAAMDAIRDDASALSGKLATRTARKGEGKDATSAEHEAVANLNLKWGSMYGLLSALGRKHAGVRSLLAEAARPRGK